MNSSLRRARHCWSMGFLLPLLALTLGLASAPAFAQSSGSDGVQATPGERKAVKTPKRAKAKPAGKAKAGNHPAAESQDAGDNHGQRTSLRSASHLGGRLRPLAPSVVGKPEGGMMPVNDGHACRLSVHYEFESDHGKARQRDGQRQTAHAENVALSAVSKEAGGDRTYSALIPVTRFNLRTKRFSEDFDTVRIAISKKSIVEVSFSRRAGVALGLFADGNSLPLSNGTSEGASYEAQSQSGNFSIHLKADMPQRGPKKDTVLRKDSRLQVRCPD